jgi:hypothetical protein
MAILLSLLAGMTIGAGIPSALAQAPAAAPQASGQTIPAAELAAIRLELKELDPPATIEEALLFRQFRDNPDDVKGFIATRKYLRMLGYPRSTKEFPLPSRAPKAITGVDYKYTLNFDEEFALFQIFLDQGLPSKPPQ